MLQSVFSKKKQEMAHSFKKEKKILFYVKLNKPIKKIIVYSFLT